MSLLLVLYVVNTLPTSWFTFSLFYFYNVFNDERVFISIGSSLSILYLSWLWGTCLRMHSLPQGYKGMLDFLKLYCAYNLIFKYGMREI